MRWLLAMLSFGAGAVHLVMVPQHAQESLGMGIAFAVGGWFQIAFGAVMLAAPRRIWLWLAIVANAVFVATWAISRTAGLPDWTGDGGTETVQAANLLCVVLEVGVVAGAVALLAAPRMLERWTKQALAVAAVVAVGVLVATTAVLASPSTATHAHGSGDEHTDVAAATGHHEAKSTHAASGSASAAGNHHAESTITYKQLPKKTKAEVDQVIALWATKYPTAADAAKDGWFRGTRSLYGIDAHYVKDVRGLSVAAPFDHLNPPILLFDGDGPDAKFAGVSYVVAEEAPEGFTGDFDFFHFHSSVCRRGGSIDSLSEDNSEVWYSESECVAAGGQVFPLAADNMIHMWIGPDYIDGAPIFAHDHPKLFDGFNPKRDG